MQQGGDPIKGPSEAAINPDWLNWSPACKGPFVQRLGLAVKSSGGFRSGQRGRYACALHRVAQHLIGCHGVSPVMIEGDTKYMQQEALWR
jgi:hypothetical protein